jgi:type II secretory pathway pseudopilin PulG
VKRSQDGYALLAVLATATITLIFMSAAMPTWRYVVQNDREEELIFRSLQVRDAIEKYQRKHGNALPPSLDVLVKGKFLRKLWKDPMSKEGKWRFIYQGQGLTPARPTGAGTGASPAPSPTPSPGRPGFSVGAITGVGSTSSEKSIRMVNGKTQYDEWHIVVGQPVTIGRQQITIGPGLPGQPGSKAPGPQPTPLRTPGR